MIGHEGEGAYRERMEAFVSGLTGTTMLELVVVSIPIPMGLWLLAEAKVMCIGYNMKLLCDTAMIPMYMALTALFHNQDGTNSKTVVLYVLGSFSTNN